MAHNELYTARLYNAVTEYIPAIETQVDISLVQKDYDRVVYPQIATLSDSSTENDENILLDKLHTLAGGIQHNDEEIAETLAVVGALAWQASLTWRTMENAYREQRLGAWGGLLAEATGVVYLLAKIWQK